MYYGSQLDKLKTRSSKAISAVTTIIQQLRATNDQINQTISQIDDDISEMTSQKDELSATLAQNTAIADKFQSLIEG